MNAQPLISVLVPFNHTTPCIGPSLATVLAQTWQKVEILAIDYGADEATCLVVRSFGDMVRLVRSSGNRARARNRGLGAASGEVIAFLDPGDLWRPAKLQLQLAALLNMQELALVFGQVAGSQLQDTCHDLSAEPGILPGALLTSRTVFDRVGGFEERWQFGEFLPWYIRALDLGCRVVVVPEVLMQRGQAPAAPAQARPRFTHSA